ncbi:MAG TPA: hypothetical protein VJC17_03995 [Candidatus Dojkabacteria bacterium]|nr:hypothetical protein [Candidatus Dojkabacteria bacterium]
MAVEGDPNLDFDVGDGFKNGRLTCLLDYILRSKRIHPEEAAKSLQLANKTITLIRIHHGSVEENV